MGINNTLRISASALTAERVRMDVISNNVANAHTTGPDGPYRRMRVVFRAVEKPAQSFNGILASQSAKVTGAGVKVVNITEDDTPGQKVYEPTNADADENGYVEYPNVNTVTEMVDMLSATKAYQANVTVINATKSMALKALSIGSK